MAVKPSSVREIDTYMGIEAFGVPVDKSEELDKLVIEARKASHLPFNDKLRRVRRLAIDSMDNAYEAIFTHPDFEKRSLMENLVTQIHPPKLRIRA